MISHRYQCIFIHIPRTAGTSVEHWIQGCDQWLIDPREKHLTGPEAKKLYAKHWQEYFKFSIIRNPASRFISMLKFSDHFGIKIGKGGLLEIEDYIERFGPEPMLEHDHRFTSRKSLLELSSEFCHQLQSGSLYRNTLGNEIDRVFLYEEMESMICELADKLGLDPARFPCLERSETSNDNQPIISEETRSKIQSMHSMDCRFYKLPNV